MRSRRSAWPSASLLTARKRVQLDRLNLQGVHPSIRPPGSNEGSLHQPVRGGREGDFRRREPIPLRLRACLVPLLQPPVPQSTADDELAPAQAAHDPRVRLHRAELFEPTPPACLNRGWCYSYHHAFAGAALTPTRPDDAIGGHGELCNYSYSAIKNCIPIANPRSLLWKASAVIGSVVWLLGADQV